MLVFPPVLQLSIAGNPQRWITFETAAYLTCKDNIAWAIGQDEFELHGGIAASTGERSILTINTIIAVKGTPSSKTNHHYSRIPLTNKALFRRDKHVCGYCGDQFTNCKLTRDHILPVSRNGKNEWTNVITSCGPCNKRKKNHLLDEIGFKLLYQPHAPSRSEWLILQNPHLLPDQLEFLLKRVSAVSRLHEK